MIPIAGMKICTVAEAPIGNILLSCHGAGPRFVYALRAMDPNKDVGLLCFDGRKPASAEFVYSESRCIDLGLRATFNWSPDLATLAWHQVGDESPIYVVGKRILARGTFANGNERPCFWDVSTGEPFSSFTLSDHAALSVRKCVLSAETSIGESLPLLPLG